MSLRHPNCPICGQPGQAVAGINAAQTRTGETRGTIAGAGVGLTTGGIGAGVAGGRVDTWTVERSRLVDMLAPPAPPAAKQPPQYGWLLLPLGVCVLLYAWWSTPLGDLQALTDSPRDWLGWLGVAAVVFGLVQLARKPAAPTPAQLAEWQERKSRWERLRYCTHDHRVYDPATGEHWTP